MEFTYCIWITSGILLSSFQNHDLFVYLYAVWAQGCFPKWAVYLRPAPILTFHPLIHKINGTSLAGSEETFQDYALEV